MAGILPGATMAILMNLSNSASNISRQTFQLLCAIDEGLHFSKTGTQKLA